MSTPTTFQRVLLHHTLSPQVDPVVQLCFCQLHGRVPCTPRVKFQFFRSIWCDQRRLLSTDNLIQFLDLFCLLQQRYHALKRFLHVWKYKHAAAGNDMDLQHTPVTLHTPNLIHVYANQRTYLFSPTELSRIIHTALSHANHLYAAPLSIKNPYTNLPFSKAVLYTLYFHPMLAPHHSDLFVHLFRCNFHMQQFVYTHTAMLRDIAIRAYVDSSSIELLHSEIANMLVEFHQHCAACTLSYYFDIDLCFPKTTLVRIMRPYLHLYIRSQSACLEMHRNQARTKYIQGLMDLYESNPLFGRRRTRLLGQGQPSFVYEDYHPPAFVSHQSHDRSHFLVSHLSHADPDPFFLDTDPDDDDDDEVEDTRL